jgi:glycosyltransferase involved in cell wall biosynthesis
VDFSGKQPSEGSKGRAVHQFVARLAWGDAVGNQVRYLQRLLRGWGWRSDIYADQWDEACREQVRPASLLPRECGAEDVLLVHHSFQSRQVPLLERTRARRALVYHNVTPGRLFEGFDRKVAGACEAARDELLAMQPWMERAYAYSRFSAEELEAAGYAEVRVLPFAVDWRAFDVAPDPTLRAELEDGCTNVLFVGRAVASKRIDDVMRVFAAYQALYQPRSRLVIAGYLNRETPYGAYLYGVKELLGAERVQILGRVSAAQLSACYASATVYLSMSRHEGFGVPLLEAMHRDVPVVAYGAAAVPETMGGAGVTTLSDDPVEVARLLAVLERRADLRQRMVEEQRARLRALGQETVAEQVREGLRPLLEGGAPRPAPLPHPSGVELVCPDFERRPEAPLSELARRLLTALPEARVLALRGTSEPAPGPLGEAGVWRFMPDQPLPRAEGRPLPGSSSLEMAVRRSRGPVVLLGVDSEVARAVLPHVQARAWGVREAGRPETLSAEAERLGARLVTLDAGEPDAVRTRLMDALRTQERDHAGG